jgi:hypothetical protein
MLVDKNRNVVRLSVKQSNMLADSNQDICHPLEHAVKRACDRPVIFRCNRQRTTIQMHSQHGRCVLLKHRCYLEVRAAACGANHPITDHPSSDGASSACIIVDKILHVHPNPIARTRAIVVELICARRARAFPPELQSTLLPKTSLL